MKIVSWNVNGIRAVAKKGLSDFIASEKPDILCLQETKANPDQVEDEIKNLGYRNSYWSSAVRKGYSGVATFTNLDPLRIERGIGFEAYDSEGRIVVTEFPQFELFNIYFPNGGSGEERHFFKQKFLKDLSDFVRPKLIAGKPIIIVGDYNIAHREIDVFDPIRLSTASGFLPEEREWMESFFKLGFVDTFRHFFPDATNRYSWWSYRELARVGNRGWRIDFISVSENLRKNLKSATILDQVQGSDHCPVVAELEF